MGLERRQWVAYDGITHSDFTHRPNPRHPAVKSASLPHMWNKCSQCGHTGRGKTKKWLSKLYWHCCMCLNMQGYP